MSDTPRTDRLKKEMSWEEFCDNAFPLLQNMERELQEARELLDRCLEEGDLYRFDYEKIEQFLERTAPDQQ
jgi:hypothetical protein